MVSGSRVGPRGCPVGQKVDEGEYLGHRRVEGLRDLLTQGDLRECRGQLWILLERNPVLAGECLDSCGNRPAPAGRHPRRVGPVVAQRNG